MHKAEAPTLVFVFAFHDIFIVIRVIDAIVVPVVVLMYVTLVEVHFPQSSLGRQIAIGEELSQILVSLGKLFLVWCKVLSLAATVSSELCQPFLRPSQS